MEMPELNPPSESIWTFHLTLSAGTVTVAPPKGTSRLVLEKENACTRVPLLVVVTLLLFEDCDEEAEIKLR